MDLFLAICEGLGLAIAAGMLAGSLAYEGPNRRWFLGLAAAAGGALFAASLISETSAAPVGIVFGAAISLFSMNLTASVVVGARQRAAAEPTAVSLIVAAAAVVLALLALFLAPLAVLAGGALLWLGLSRYRREAQKHEGLRVLR